MHHLNPQQFQDHAELHGQQLANGIRDGRARRRTAAAAPTPAMSGLHVRAITNRLRSVGWWLSRRPAGDAPRVGL
jgi:hypothetical protein